MSDYPSVRSLLALSLTLVLACSQGAASGQQPAEAERPGVRYFNQDWNFDEVDVGRLIGRLARIGLELPVELDGQISGTIDVGIPWGALGTARAWRLGGSLTSPALTVDGFVLRDVTVRLRYREGVLRLEQLSVRMPPPGAAGEANADLITGTAAMELIPRGQLTASTEVQSLSLLTILQRFVGLPPIDGQLSGTLAAEVDVDRMNDLAAWRITGPVTLRNFTVRNSPPGEASVRVAVRDAVLAASGFRLAMGSAVITSNGRLNLLGNQAWNVAALLETTQVSALLDLLAGLLQTEALGEVAQHVGAGGLRASAQLSGTLTPQTAAASGHADFTNLEFHPPPELSSRVPLRPLRVDALSFDYALADAALQLTQISATLAGGRAVGAATVPLGEGNAEAALEWNGLRVADILAEPFGGPGVSSGQMNLTVPAGQWGDLTQWRLSSNATLTEARYDDWSITAIQTGAVTLADGRLQLPAFAAQLDGQPVSLSLDMQLAAPHTIDATFNIARFPLAWLTRVPQLADYAGRIGGAASATGQISGTWQPLRLQGNGQLAGRALRLDAHTIDSLELKFAVTPEQLALLDIRAALYRGSASGSATLTLGENIGLAAALNWTGVDAAAIAGPLLAPPVAVAGPTSGSATINIPAGAIDDRTQWTGSGAVELDQLIVFGLSFVALNAPSIELARGELRASQVTAALDGRTVAAVATVTIAAPYAYQAELDFDQIRVEHLGTLLQVDWLRDRGRGRVDFAAKLHGPLDPFMLNATGAVAGESLALFDHPIDRINFTYSYNAESLTLSRLDAALYQGRLTGEVRVPLVDEADGAARLQWTGIDLGQSVGNMVELPFNLQGQTDGRASIAIPAGAVDHVADWTIDAHMNLPGLSANGLAIAALELDVNQQARALTYSAIGNLLGGALTAEGRRNPADPGEGLAALGDVSLTLRGASVATAIDATRAPSERPSPVAGTLDVTLIGSNAKQGWTWRTDLTLRQLRANGVAITDGLTARVSGNDRLIRVEQVAGSFAGGQLFASGGWRVGARRPPAFRIGVRSARLEQLAALAGDPRESALAGLVDIEFTVRPGPVWRIGGTVATGQGDLSGVRFSNARIPIDADWHPASGRIRVQVPTVAISLAGGRVTGRLTAQRTAGWMLDGAFRFYRVDFVTLVRQFGSASQYGSGRLTGTLTLAGRNMRDLNDLQATLIADLEDSHAGNLPVFSDLGRYVPGAGLSSATQFQEGRVEARLARGVINVEQLTLASRQLDIYMTGTVNLSGRLGLEAVVYTGQRDNPLLAEFLLRRFTEVASAPVALLVSANEFLSNRVIRLQIAGTISRPVIRVRPLEMLSEEIVRYFLRRAAGAVIGISAPVPALADEADN